MSSSESEREKDGLSDHVAAWNPQRFAELSESWRLTLSRHFEKMTRREGAVLGDFRPEELLAEAERALAESNDQTLTTDRFSELLQLIVSHSQNLHHPRYIGHQVPASNPIAGLFDAAGSILNQPMAVFEMGPWATAAEYAVVRKMCAMIGWDSGASSGVLTSGGSLANLTALLTARNIAFPDAWERGVPSNACLIAHTDAHYCINRAAGILGLGTNAVHRVPLDARRRMDPRRLESVIQKTQSTGQKIIAVCACSCATPIGAFDDLNSIADVCERYGVWLHVDAAHGGGVLLSRRHRSLLDGLDRADSVVWDAHKMMFVPALCGAVLYRNREHRFETFRQDAPYLFDPNEPEAAEFDGGMRTLECTKRSLAFGIWGIWSLCGDAFFEGLVDQMFDLARYLHSLLDDAADFETRHVPQGNIVVFRHLPESIRGRDAEGQNAFQFRLRAAMVKSGQFYIVQTKIDGIAALRVTMMNPLTTPRDLDELIEALREAGTSPTVLQHPNPKRQ